MGMFNLTILEDVYEIMFIYCQLGSLFAKDKLHEAVDMVVEYGIDAIEPIL